MPWSYLEPLGSKLKFHKNSGPTSSCAEGTASSPRFEIPQTYKSKQSRAAQPTVSANFGYGAGYLGPVLRRRVQHVPQTGL